MTEKFKTFLSQLKDTHFSLMDYVDFPKVQENVEAVSIKLNQLNYLIGQEDMSAAVKRLWQENPKVFTVLCILIAVRTKDKKKSVDVSGNIHYITDYFTSAEQVLTFLNETGLTEVFQQKQIKNLVDYVFGVEVGLDTHSRKNRGGTIMEKRMALILTQNGIEFEQEVNFTEFPAIVSALGVDKKRFDFVIKTPAVTYLIETNFYSEGGTKLNEVARSYTELAIKINAVPGFEFVWVTDGKGWLKAKNKLEEAFKHIPNIYNLSDLPEFIDKVKV
ncbi:MAG: type II restriction endonuclease [Muribaculaceae bacterium]|nr:type II restriction endonuclease [Muribaculaceae bacterium]